MSEVALTPERKKLQELGAEELKAISTALLALSEDDEITKEVMDEENAVRLFIKEWLQGRNPSPRLEGVTFLQIPNFYLDPEQIKRIAELTDIDDFPVLEPDDLTYVDEETGLELRRNEWQTSLLALFMKNLNTQQAAHIYLQPASSEWVYTSGEKVKLYTSAWDSHGHFSPPMGTEAIDFIDLLIKYGEELSDGSSTT